MRTRSMGQVVEVATRTPVVDELETDDDLIRRWQDELREARDKIELYRSEAAMARAFEADRRHTETALESLPLQIRNRRAEIAHESWARGQLPGFVEIPVVSKDHTFASVGKEHLTQSFPELARAIPKKSVLWEHWSVWNFRRRPLHRAEALPAEAVHRARNAIQHFERLEVWQAVGMADPWLVGVMLAPSGQERYYLLFDWGLESTLDRDLLR